VRFLLDQDVYAVTCRMLRDLGHDVVTAAELNLSRSPDKGLLMRAADEKRLFVTRDKDFGGLVFVERLGKGVLYLRISPETLAATHEEFRRVLSTYTQAELAVAFVVVEPGRHRFRTLR
jgi:predicted nuclease of predicted toxin-antitoxin system